MHQFVLVIGPEVEGQLAPHEGKHWDHYQIGGRYSGSITLKPSGAGELGDRSIPPIEKEFARMGRSLGGRVIGPGPALTVVGKCADSALKKDVERVAYPLADCHV